MKQNKHAFVRQILALAMSLHFSSISHAQTPHNHQGSSTLTGFASMPAETFAGGPPSGAFNRNGLKTQSKYTEQPVLGFSAVVPLGNNEFYAMPDNGFGSQKNSPDFLLRVYRVSADMRDKRGGRGTLAIHPNFIQLQDPNKKINFLIVNENTPGRLLTGADFDIESMVIADDGSFWFGDERGPFLLHTDAMGNVLSAPIELTDFSDRADPRIDRLRSPDSPFLKGPDPGEISPASVNRSRGFEATALSIDGNMLYCFLEAPLFNSQRNETLIHEYSLVKNAFTGAQWYYPLEDVGHLVADVATINKHEFLVIERDTRKGNAAMFKRLYKIKLTANGKLQKSLVADLLTIEDKVNISGFAENGLFRFQHQCIETVAILDKDHVILANDNNFPNAGERVPGELNPTEMIIIKLNESLHLSH